MTWPLVSGQWVATHGSLSATSGGTAITAADSEDTKGSWVELVPATAHDAVGMLVTLGPVVNSFRWIGLDIGIGSSSNEVVIAADLFGFLVSNFYAHSYLIPLAVPAGARIAARIQASHASATCQVSVTLLGGAMAGPEQLQSLTTMGFIAATTRGTEIIAPSEGAGGPNLKSGWVEIASATVRRFRGLILSINTTVTFMSEESAHLLDIGVGASTSETVLVPNLRFVTDPAHDQFVPSVVGPLWLDIPAGTRLAARMQSSSTSASNMTMDVVLYGIG